MTPEQRLLSCQVSKTEVEKMTTSALVETVVKYPYLVNMLAFDSIEYGIEAVSSYFPGLKVLLERPDATQELTNYYNREISEEFLTESQKKEEDLIQLYILKLLEVLSFRAENGTSQLRLGSATVRTPRNTPVSVTIYEAWIEIAAHNSWMDLQFLSELAAQNYASAADYGWSTRFPNAVMLDTYNYYNCFSYAFYMPATTNRYWMDDPSAYMTDGSYVTTSYASANNRVTYVGSYGNIAHAGIVNSVSGNSITVTSKWAYGGLYRHSVYDCPFYIGYASSVRYWAAA